MKIPKRFKLFGQTISVNWDSQPFVENPDAIAFACYRKNEIQMNPNMPFKSDEQMQQSFLHELVHFIIYFSQTSVDKKCQYLHQDEPFIDMTANLLHQAMITMEYE